MNISKLRTFFWYSSILFYLKGHNTYNNNRYTTQYTCTHKFKPITYCINSCMPDINETVKKKLHYDKDPTNIRVSKFLIYYKFCIFDGFDNYATCSEEFVEHKSTRRERGFQKRKRRFTPGIEWASSVVDDPIPFHQKTWARQP
jgi:hypothetical protein